MTDYLFLKLSEMALRAIERPRRGQWVFMLRVNEVDYMFGDYPISIDYVKPRIMKCIFKAGTYVLYNGQVRKINSFQCAWRGTVV